MSTQCSIYNKKHFFDLFYESPKGSADKIMFFLFSLSANSSLVISSLVVEEASPKDTGTYKCSSPAGDSKEAAIHVITGLESLISK